jgi:hypothetical protein
MCSCGEEFVEGIERGDERGARVVVEAVEPLLEHGGAGTADRSELVAAGVRERDADGARVGGIRGAAHEPVVLEPADDAGHRRLRDALGGGKVRDPQRALLVEAPQGQQRPDAVALGGEVARPAARFGRFAPL